MTQHTLAVGSRVEVTGRKGCAFYSRSYGKRGVVTKLTINAAHVKFDDGTEDWGRRDGVTVIQGVDGFVVGARVKVTAWSGGTFYSRHEGKQGVIERRVDNMIYVRFDHDGTTDYGMIENVELVVAAPATPVKDAQGFISNAGNTTGKLPAERGTKMDILYMDGTLILDLAIGTGVPKRASNNSNSYSATAWAYSERGSATIKAYRFIADRPVEAPVVRLIKREDVKKGMQVKLISDNGGHRHWGFKIGGVYDCIDGAIQAPGSDVFHRGTNYGDWVWEVVKEAPAPTLDEQLAALKAELTQIKAEKERAEAGVVAAQALVDAAEAKRAEIIGRLSKHGIQFIGEEGVKAQTAQEAFAAGTLEVGMTLLAVTPEDEHEHTAGRQYKITHRDRDDSSEFKLESNDGYGWWVRNDELGNYTVVV